MISIQANAPNLNLTDCLKTALIVAMQIYIVDGRVREVPAARLADVAALRPALLLWEIIPERTIGLYPMNRVSDTEPIWHQSLVTRSSQRTIPNMTPIDMRQTPKNTVHATQMGQAL